MSRTARRIRLVPTAATGTVGIASALSISKRYYALADFSRFIRPDAGSFTATVPARSPVTYRIG